MSVELNVFVVAPLETAKDVESVLKTADECEVVVSDVYIEEVP